MLVVNPTLMSLLWLFGLCLYDVWLFDMHESSYGIIHKIGLLRCPCGMKESILNFTLSTLFLV